MKKIFSIFLLIVFLSSTMIAYSETVPTPHIENFAVLKTKAYDNYIELTFDRHVDRVFVNWLGYGETLEEICLNEYNRATVMTVGHKYMPGVPYNNVGKVACVSDYVYVRLPANDCPPTTQAIIDSYQNRTDVKVIDVVYPMKTTVVCERGQYVDLMDGFVVLCPNMSTSAVATPTQIAYMTLQGEWLVSYSRSGVLLYIAYNGAY